MLDILLPYYGDAALMRQAVESVLAQTCPEWRLVVVDDHDPDPSTGEWLAALDDPRITYHRNDRTMGVNANFRRCLELSNASHVAFMGCDDVMLPDHVAVVTAAAARRPGADMIQPQVRVVDAAGNEHRPVTDRVKSWVAPRVVGDVVLEGESLATRLMLGNWLYFPAIIWRRDTLARHPFARDLETALDLRLIMDIVLEGGELMLVEGTTFAYRRHVASASTVTAMAGARFLEETTVSAEFADLCVARGWPRAARSARMRLTSRLHAVARSAGMARAGDLRTATALFRHAMSTTRQIAQPVALIQRDSVAAASPESIAVVARSMPAASLSGSVPSSAA